jgi:hypothetical protein
VGGLNVSASTNAVALDCVPSLSMPEAGCLPWSPSTARRCDPATMPSSHKPPSIALAGWASADSVAALLGWQNRRGLPVGSPDLPSSKTARSCGPATPMGGSGWGVSPGPTATTPRKALRQWIWCTYDLASGCPRRRWNRTCRPVSSPPSGAADETFRKFTTHRLVNRHKGFGMRGQISLQRTR